MENNIIEEPNIEEPNIKEPNSIFNLGLELDAFICLLSARRTGKSVLMAELMYYYLNHPDLNGADMYLYLFSNTAGLHSGTNEQYDFLDKQTIIPARPEIMNKVIRGLFESQKKTKFKNKILICFDDIVITHKYEIIEMLASLGRHYGITTILSAQIATSCISPTIRNNTSYLFFRRLTNNSIKDNIYPILGIAFENPRSLVKFTEDNIKNYQFIFYNNNKDYDEDSIQIIKSEPVPKDFKYKVLFKQPKQKKRRIVRRGDKHLSIMNPPPNFIKGNNFFQI